MNIYRYIAQSKSMEANGILSNYGLAKCQTEKEIEAKLKKLTLKYRAEILKDIADIHPDKDLILQMCAKPEKSYANACGCGASADGGCDCDCVRPTKNKQYTRTLDSRDFFSPSPYRPEALYYGADGQRQWGMDRMLLVTALALLGISMFIKDKP